MQHFNLFNTVLLTFPETIFNMYFSFLVVGESRHLPLKDGKPDRRKNVFKLILSVISISLFTDILALYVPDMNIKSLISMVFATVTVFCIYRINIFKSLLAVVSFIIFMLSIEAPYMSLIINLVFKSLDNFQAYSPWVRFPYTLPVRAMQLIGIISVWNLKIAFDCAKRVHIRSVGFIALLILLLTMETSMYVNFLVTFPILPFANKILGFLGIVAVAPVNYFIFYLYISTINKAIRYNIGVKNAKRR
jgi:hypothetical protein